MRTRQLAIIAAIVLWAPHAAQAQVAFTQRRDTVRITECDSESSSQAVITGGQQDYSTVLVTNSGTAKAYVTTGPEAVVATPQNIPILPDSQQLIALPRNHTYVACITTEGTADVEFTPGNGN